MAEDMTQTSESPEKRELSLLNVVCFVCAGLFIALVAYNLFAAGSIISTDGLFFTVVPLFLALCFLVVPGADIWAKRKEAKAREASGEISEAATAHAEPVEVVHFAGSNRLFLSIWFWLLGLTALEVLLVYIQL